MDSLKQLDNDAVWDEFLSLYGGFIRGYAIRKGCTEDAAEVYCRRHWLNNGTHVNGEM